MRPTARRRWPSRIKRLAAKNLGLLLMAGILAPSDEGARIMFAVQAFGVAPFQTTTILQCRANDLFVSRRNSRIRPRKVKQPTSIFALSENDKETATSVDPKPLPRRRQLRRQSANRRPKYYWTKPQNLWNEVQQFWTEQVGVVVETNTTLIIPNERVLHFYHRHDLRAALASQGGRTKVATTLESWANEKRAKVYIMPGRWKEVLEQASQHMEIQQLLEQEPALANMPTTPTSGWANPQQEQNIEEQQQQLPDGDDEVMVASKTSTSTNTTKKWAHTNQRKPKGYWSLQRVIEELYQYGDGVAKQHGRPAAFMPRPNELTASGRDDLKQAMSRFGGTKRICELARMVPFREWMYVEGQLDLMVQLQDYLDEAFADVPLEERYRAFPATSDIRNHGGYETLFSLIQYYGGRKHVAMRLSMEASGASSFVLGPQQSSSRRQQKQLSPEEYRVSFGPFDLQYGIRLLSFVRNEYLHNPKLAQPPLVNPVILMPTPHLLVRQSTTLAALPSSREEQDRSERGNDVMADLVKEANIVASSSSLAKLATTAAHFTTQEEDANCQDNGSSDGDDDPTRTVIRYQDDPTLWLHLKTMEYGGYENVARRLGLALSPTTNPFK